MCKNERLLRKREMITYLNVAPFKYYFIIGNYIGIESQVYIFNELVTVMNVYNLNSIINH